MKKPMERVKVERMLNRKEKIILSVGREKLNVESVNHCKWSKYNSIGSN